MFFFLRGKTLVIIHCRGVACAIHRHPLSINHRATHNINNIHAYNIDNETYNKHFSCVCVCGGCECELSAGAGAAALVTRTQSWFG